MPFLPLFGAPPPSAGPPPVRRYAAVMAAATAWAAAEAPTAPPKPLVGIAPLIPAAGLVTRHAEATANYPLDEASGTAFDAVGSLDLTENGTVGTRSAGGFTARDFTGSDSNYLSRAVDTADTPGSGDFWVVAKVYLDSTANQVFVCDDVASIAAWYIGLFGNRFYVGVRQSDSVIREVEATNFGTPATSAVHVVILQLSQSGASDEVRISVDGNTFATETPTAFTGPAITPDSSFRIGRYTSTGYPADAGIWDVTVGKGVFTDQDAADLWNSGSPVPFANWTGAPAGPPPRRPQSVAAVYESWRADEIAPLPRRRTVVQPGQLPVTVTYSADEHFVTVVVGPDTYTIPRPEVVPWAFLPTGTTYWVEPPPTGSDSNPGTSGAPFATIQHAINQMSAGDMTYVRAGTYTEQVSFSTAGTPGHPIVLSCAPGALGQAVLRPAEAYAGGALVTIGVDHVWVNGLTLHGPRGLLAAPASEHFGANGVSVTTDPGAGGGIRLMNLAAYYNVHCGLKDRSANAAGMIFEGCLAFLNGGVDTGIQDHGIYCPADSQVVRGNVCFRNTGYAVHSYSAPSGQTITRNVCFANGLSGGGGGILIAGTNTTVTYNTVGNDWTGVTYFRSGCQNNSVRFNVFNAPSYYDAGMDTTGGAPSGNVANYNDYYPGNFLNSPPIGDHDVTVNPLFLDPAAGDFRVTVGSAAAAMGAYAYLPSQTPALRPAARGVLAAWAEVEWPYPRRLAVAPLIPAGAQTQDLSGTVTPSGLLTSQAQKPLAGAVTPSGDFTALKVILQSLSGSVTPSGTSTQQTQKYPAGATTLAGVLTGAVAHALSGSTTLSGSFSALKVLLQSLSGSVTATGALTRSAAKTFAGALTAAGVLTSAVAHALAGSTTPTATLTRAVSHALSGSTTLSGALSELKVIIQSLSGALTAAGVLTLAVAHALTGSTTPTATLTRAVTHALSGSTTLSGALSELKVIIQSLSGSLTAAGVLTSAVAHALAGAMTPAGTLTGAIAHALAGGVTLSGAFTAIKVILQSLSGSVTQAGALAKSCLKPLAGTVSQAGALTRAVGKSLTGAVSESSLLTRSSIVVLAGAVAVASTLTRFARKTLAAVSTLIGSFSKSFNGETLAEPTRVVRLTGRYGDQSVSGDTGGEVITGDAQN